MTRLLQGVLGTLLLAVLVGVGVACTSTAAPSPSASAPASKPAASEPARAVPSSSPSAGSNDAAWKADWDKTVAAAKKEGKVVVAGGPSELYRNAVMSFQKAYPEIQVEFSGIGGAPFATRVLAERQAGQYLWDTCHCGWNSPLTMLNPAGALDPLKPQLLLPEVLDDSKWRDGLNANWADKERQKVFEFEGRLTFMAWVNRKMASESELQTVDQLVDPKWKGKIAVQDPRVPGVMSTAMGYLLALKGEDWVRKLLEQDLTVVKEGRQQAEGLVRESYPIAMGVASADFEQFAREGLMGNIKPLEPDSAAGARVTSGFGVALLMNKAPHPNAVKVYLNWLLSKEGQKAWVEATAQNSRRLDVEGPAETAPRRAIKYEVSESEESPLKTSTDRAMALAKELVK